MSEPELWVEPLAGMRDAPVAIRLRGLQPGSSVTLEAAMADKFGAEYRSSGTFTADALGEVDPAAQAPSAGTWDGVEPMGLFWSMEQTSGAKSGELLHELPESTSVTLVARRGDAELARAELVRWNVGPGTRVEDVTEGGLVGRLYTPARGGPFPGMLVLTGSGGGLALDTAAALSSHGYAALALGYFGVPGRPDELSETPVEYPKAGRDWLAARDDVAADATGVMGTSKGGELALLLGAIYPEFRAVVAWVPSTLVYAWGRDGDRVLSSWTRGGKPVPCAGVVGSRNTDTKPPFSIRKGYEAALESPDEIERAAIALERTNGPILMITGEDDAMWPSSPYAELGMRRLRQHDFPHRYEHLCYAGAGHNVGVPNLPTTLMPSRYLAMGGRPADTARASRESWAVMLAFLDESLRA